MESILNIECSMFADARSTAPKPVILLDWLKDKTFLRLQERVRACATKDEKDIVKKEMPCITPSGLFSKRGKDYLIKHSGLIAIDIDGKDNTHVSNFSDLKNVLCKLPQIAYCGLSVSGQGYWALIPIAYPDKHEKHYQFLEKFFADKGLIIDPACKDVGRLRFYSYDPDAYFNHNAKQLQKFYSPPIIKPKQYAEKNFFGDGVPVWEQYNKSDEWIKLIEDRGWSFWRKRGDITEFTRPEKTGEKSAEFNPSASWTDDAGNFHKDVPIFRVWTSSAPPFEPKAYTPFMVYALLEHNNDLKAAAKSLHDKTKSNFKVSTPAKIQPQKKTIAPAKVDIRPDPITKADAITKPREIVSDKNDIVINQYGYPAKWDEVETIKPGAWSSQINEFEKFFTGRQLPTEPVRLNSFCEVNIAKMVESHLATIKRNEGKKTFIVFIDRLNELKNYLENNTSAKC